VKRTDKGGDDGEQVATDTAALFAVGEGRPSAQRTDDTTSNLSSVPSATNA